MDLKLVTFAFSQFLGLYMLIMSCVMFLRVESIRRMINTAHPESGTIFFAASIGLMLGIVFIGINDHWVLKPIVVLTIISWFFLIYSLFWLLMPERMLISTKHIFLGRGYYVVVIFLSALSLMFVGRGVYIYVNHRNEFDLLHSAMKLIFG